MKASLIATHKSITKKLSSSMPAAPPAAGPTAPSVITPTTKRQRPCRQKSTRTSSKPTTKSPSTARGEHSHREAPVRSREDHSEDVVRTCQDKVLYWSEIGRATPTQTHFTVTGSVNNRVTDKTNETVLTIDADTKTLVEKNKQEWDPHTVLMILDGLEAIKWAWTLIRLGEEVDINNF